MCAGTNTERHSLLLYLCNHSPKFVRCEPHSFMTASTAPSVFQWNMYRQVFRSRKTMSSTATLIVRPWQSPCANLVQRHLNINLHARRGRSHVEPLRQLVSLLGSERQLRLDIPSQIASLHASAEFFSKHLRHAY